MVVNSVSLSKPGKGEKYIAVLNVYIGLDQRKLQCAQYLLYSNGIIESRKPSEFFNRFLHSSIYEWSKKMDTYSKNRIQARTRSLKKDILTAVWHPKRVAKWVEAGCALEDL